MPQNQPLVYSNVKRALAAPAVLKAKPGYVYSVTCITPGTINLINDVTTGGAGTSIPGFPATMTANQVLPVNQNALVGITAKAVTGSYNVNFA